MRRITSSVLVALVAFGAVAAAEALGPESVPVADTVELHGEVPESGPPPSGFFIVPPRVIDMRDDETPGRLEDDEAADHSDDSEESTGSSGDDGQDDLDDADDSVDDPDDPEVADDDEADDEVDDDGDDADD